MDKPMTFNEWMGTLGFDALVHANCCRKAYEAGQQSQQAKVEELQKRVGAVTHLIRGLRAEFDLWMDVECPQVERQIELLEQALKGEGCQ